MNGLPAITAIAVSATTTPTSVATHVKPSTTVQLPISVATTIARPVMKVSPLVTATTQVKNGKYSGSGFRVLKDPWVWGCIELKIIFFGGIFRRKYPLTHACKCGLCTYQMTLGICMILFVIKYPRWPLQHLIGRYLFPYNFYTTEQISVKLGLWL